MEVTHILGRIRPAPAAIGLACATLGSCHHCSMMMREKMRRTMLYRAAFAFLAALALLVLVKQHQMLSLTRVRRAMSDGPQTINVSTSSVVTTPASSSMPTLDLQCVKQIFEMRCPSINRTWGSGGSSPRPLEARNFCYGYLVAYRRVYFRA